MAVKSPDLVQSQVRQTFATFAEASAQQSDESEKVNAVLQRADVGGSTVGSFRWFLATDAGARVMSAGQVTFIGQNRQSERLVDRARRRRNELLGMRTVWVVQTTQGGQDIVEHRFLSAPRIVDLIARTGAEACLLELRTENQMGRRRDDATVVAG